MGVVMQRADVRQSAWSYVLDEPTRVLVVDDDPILREFASVYLSTPTATIVTAANGQEALAFLESEPCDIAVLDIEMPVLDGFGLLTKIRADRALDKLPVMMLTGHDDIASIDRAFNLGANAFALKPVNWRLLSYQIRYVLRSSRMERQQDEQFDPSVTPERDPDDRAALRAVLAEASAISCASEAEAHAQLARIRQLAETALRQPIARETSAIAHQAAGRLRGC
jgi:DNA-binding response OmpR family regulator